MSMFQKSVVNKYLANLDNEKVEKAYKAFKNNYTLAKTEKIRKLKEEEYQDGFLRDIFVDALGYILNPDDDYNLMREFKNQSDGKKADGAIIKNGKAVAVIELKSTRTKDLTSITQQAFNYKNNQPGCKYVITSNFQKLRFYIDYADEHEEFDLFTLSKEDFEMLYLLLSKDSMFSDIPLKLKKESVFHEENVSKQLYKDYSVFKTKLFDNLVESNPKYDKLTLFKKSQKLIDRFLFMLFAEDRGLLPPNMINKGIKRFELLKYEDSYKPLYEIFKQFFDYLNFGRKGKEPADDIPGYNGGLFYPDEILDDVRIDDEVLIHDLQKLSAYDFNSEVDVNILGHIFEHSLSEIEEVTAELEGTAPDKTKSKRKKDGVFYTPKYITQYIVENTIGTLCKEKREEMNITEIEFDDTYYNKNGRLSAKGKKLFDILEEYKEWLLSLKIVDPACGSGAFLNQALNFLIEEHRVIDEIIADLTKMPLGLFDVDKAILENNLYGVDINEESIEIAKLSLWLHTAQKGRKLSNLNDNIKCGNSLIDDPEVAGDKAFNWKKEFPEIMNKGGFDVVIGNPPYVSVELMSAIEKEFYKNEYATFFKRSDLFSIFIDLATAKLTKTGYISFIIPSIILNNLSYKKIRNRLLDNKWLRNVCYTGGKVFSDATVETVIFVIRKVKTEQIKLTNALNFSNPKIHMVNADYFKAYGNCISVGKEEIGNISDKMFKPDFETIDKHFKVFQGIVTGNNNAYIFENENETYKYNIEKELLKPLCHGRDIGKWEVKNTERRIAYVDSHTNISKYPNAEKWLKQFKDTLSTRRECVKGVIPWYALQWARRKEDLNMVPKIVIQNTRNESLKTRMVATIDLTGFYSTQGVNFIIPITEEYSVFFLLALLNSKMMNSLFLTKFLNLAIKADYLKQICFPKLSLLDQQPFIDKADSMLELNQHLQDKKNKFLNRVRDNFEIEKISKKLDAFYDFEFKDFVGELKKQKIKLSLLQQDDWEEYFIAYKTEINNLQSEIAATDKTIDQMVYDLYGLTEDEIRIVEESQ